MSLTDIIRIVRNPTVDSVLASFTAAVADLHAIVAVKSEELASIADKRVSLAMQERAAVDERNRAASVASKIEALIK